MNAVALHNLRLVGSSAYDSLLSSLVISSGLNALTLIILYSLKLKLPDLFYFLAIIITNLILFLSQLLVYGNNVKSFIKKLIEEASFGLPIKLTVAIGILTMVVISSGLPPIGNDILEYFEIGKIFYKEKAIIYPVNPHYLDNLFSSHASHPPFFTVVQSLGFIIQGFADSFFINQLLSGYYLLLFFLLLTALLKDKLFIGFVLINLSIFISDYALNAYFTLQGLDTFRAVYFLFTFFVLEKLISKQDSNSLLIILGLALGLSLFTHSSGLLFFIIMIPIFLASYTQASLKRKYINLVVIISIAITLGGYQYFINFYNYGSFVSDDLLVWSKYGYQDYMRYERNLYTQRKMFGQLLKILQPNYYEYGYFYVFLAVLAILNIKKLFVGIKDSLLNAISKDQKPLQKFMPAILFVIGFYLTAIVSILLGKDIIVKNYRYLLTPYPFVVISVCFLFMEFIKNIPEIWKTKLIIINTTRAINSSKVLIKKNYTVIFPVIMIIAVCIYANLGIKVYSRAEKVTQRLSTEFIRTYLQNNYNKNDVIFAFDRADLYSGLPNNKISFYLDDSAVAYFDINNPGDLFDALKTDGVKYIFVANYIPFILNKSSFSSLLTSPEYTSLIALSGIYKLYKLNDPVQHNFVGKEVIFEKNITLDPYQTIITNIAVEKDEEYLVKINSHSSKIKAFYELFAYDKLGVLSYYTYDESSCFRIKSNTDSISLKVTAKNENVNISIQVIKLENYVQR